MPFKIDEDEASRPPRVGDVFTLGNLISNQTARSRRVKFKLRKPYRKRSAEKATNPNYKAYSRTFSFLDNDYAVTDNGLKALMYDTTVRFEERPDVSRVPLRLSYSTSVVVTGFDI